jgi:YegS/Rv2252/BmrU family lipid kinase
MSDFLQMQKVAVVVNPAAGSGKGAEVYAQTRQSISDACKGKELQFVETAGKEHAVSLGASLDAQVIILISGDGTVHDVAQGIMSRPRDSRPVIAPIPVGSGNDFARTLKIPKEPSSALAALTGSVKCSIDVGICNDTYFLETLSFGVDAAVGLNTAELRKTTKARGAVLYAHAAVLAILTDLRANSVQMNIDGRQIDEQVLIMAIQNGPTYGGGFKVAPSAQPDDGLLNYCYATRISAPKALFYLARMKNGNHEQLKSIHTGTARQMSVRFAAPVATQCDGEPLDGTSFDVSLLASALDVMAQP